MNRGRHGIRSWQAIVERAAIVCAAFLGVLPAMGQQHKATFLNLEAPGANLIDAKKVIDALENHNPIPKLIKYGDGYSPLFDEKYNWSEYERVVKLIRFSKCHGEEAWPELLKHFDDKRYCISVGLEEFDSGVNWTVGEVCQEIVDNYLRAAYDRHMYNLGLDEVRYWRLRPPARVRKPEDVKAWCEARREKKLYQLQMEMCQWAIEQSATAENDPKRREAFVSAVRGEVKTLRQTRTAVGYRWLGEGMGSTLRYDAERAAKIRAYWKKSN